MGNTCYSDYVDSHRSTLGPDTRWNGSDGRPVANKYQYPCSRRRQLWIHPWLYGRYQQSGRFYYTWCRICNRTCFQWQWKYTYHIERYQRSWLHPDGSCRTYLTGHPQQDESTCLCATTVFFRRTERKYARTICTTSCQYRKTGESITGFFKQSIW